MLSSAGLRGADLTETDLQRADLRGALLDEVTLSVTDLRSARLDGAEFRDTEGRPLLQEATGVGVRFLSPIGPIRVDLAYRFRGAQELSVVTTQIRPFDPLVDDPDDPRDGPLSVNGEFIPYVRTNNIALLTPRVLFGESSAFSLRRFQIHLSIGQAF